MKKQHFYLLAGLFCLLVGLNTATAQEKEYLNENFNKATMQAFPPYGWRNVDADGDGAGFHVSTDGFESSLAAVSASTYIVQARQPDNWLVTPQLYVEKATDSLKYYVSSFFGQNGGAEHYEVWVSTKSSDIEDFTFLLDSLTFTGNETPRADNTPYKKYLYIDTALSLERFVGQNIFIAFRHKYQGRSYHSLIIDNISGPQIVPFKHDLAIVNLLKPLELECDLEDAAMEVVIENKGTEPVSRFNLTCQSQGVLPENAEDAIGSFSDPITETVERTIEPGDTIHYMFEGKLPLGQYVGGFQYIVGAFLGYDEDVYGENDTLATFRSKQSHFNLPLYTSFESNDTTDAYKGWYTGSPSVSYRPIDVNSGNANWARTGMTRVIFANYPASSYYPERTGLDAYLATRCLALESGAAYRVNLYYAFRLFDLAAEQKAVKFRLIAGQDQRHLLDDYFILIDTTLTWNDSLVGAPTSPANFSLFSSNPFQVETSGTYYLGLQIYTDEAPTSTWMIFVDDFSLTDATAEMPVDVILQSIDAPYDCNLTENEFITFNIKNASSIAVNNLTVSYCINNGEWVSETMTEFIEPNENKNYTFKTPADFSGFSKYKIDGKIEYPTDTIKTDNNEKSFVTENTKVLNLPYADDFELYSSVRNMEDYYRTITTGYFGFGAANDYTPDTLYAYNGIGFLASALDDEVRADADDWIISRCLQFQKDSTYEISFAYRIEKENPQQAHLDAYLLSAYDKEAVTAELGKLSPKSTAYEIAKYEYKPAEDAILHFALHAHGEFGSPIMMIDALYIGAPRTAEPPTANEDFLSGHMEVYPNPANEYLTVQSDFTAEGLKLTNMMGETVYQTTFDGAGPIHLTLNTATYKPGIYFLTLYAKEATIAVKKVVIR